MAKLSCMAWVKDVYDAIQASYACGAIDRNELELLISNLERNYEYDISAALQHTE